MNRNAVLTEVFNKLQKRFFDMRGRRAGDAEAPTRRALDFRVKETESCMEIIQEMMTTPEATTPFPALHAQIDESLNKLNQNVTFGKMGHREINDRFAQDTDIEKNRKMLVRQYAEADVSHATRCMADLANPKHEAIAQAYNVTPELVAMIVKACGVDEVMEDHRRLVRKLDVLLNGEEGAAKQASLVDIVSQVEHERRVAADLDKLQLWDGIYVLYDDVKALFGAVDHG